jgi:hypothetical protein
VPDDPRVTHKLRLIELHYAKLGDDLRWNAARYRRLAGNLVLTVYELGAILRLKPRAIDDYLSRDAFPPTVELHLTLLERALYPSSLPPVFPSELCSSTTTS